MTLPNERARALHWAGEFIKELCNTGEISEKRRQEAQVILRHYPTAAEIGYLDPIPPEKLAPAVAHPTPTVESQNIGRFKNLYGVLTGQEMADRLNCSPEAVYERAVAGELLYLSSPARSDDRYPAFQLDERLDKSLLEQTMQKYLEADVNSTLLWSFLRRPQKIYRGLTPIDMLLGGMLLPAYETLTPKERSDMFLEVVDEEISRVRW